MRKQLSEKDDEPAQQPNFFSRFTTGAASALGKPWVFGLAVVALILWAFSGPVLGFSDTWQLIINTGTTIVTFLMVFIIQNTQNRDSAAMHVKLDALMCELKVSNAKLYEAEKADQKELEKMRTAVLKDA